MLLNTRISIAVKDNAGKYEISEVSLFQLNGFSINSLCFEVTKNNITLRCNCPFCDEIHSYNYEVKKMLNRNLIVGGCESIGIPVFYIGKSIKVSQMVSRYNEVNEKIYAMI